MTDSDSQCLDFPWMLAKNTSALKHVSQLRRPKQKPSALKQQVPDDSGSMTARFADLQHTKKRLLCLKDNITPGDLRQLVKSEEERHQMRHFRRPFPSEKSHKYLKFMDKLSYYDKLLDAFEFKYSDQRNVGIQLLRNLCDRNRHI